MSVVGGGATTGSAAGMGANAAGVTAGVFAGALGGAAVVGFGSDCSFRLCLVSVGREDERSRGASVFGGYGLP